MVEILDDPFTEEIVSNDDIGGHIRVAEKIRERVGLLMGNALISLVGLGVLVATGVLEPYQKDSTDLMVGAGVCVAVGITSLSWGMQLSKKMGKLVLEDYRLQDILRQQKYSNQN